MPLYPGNNLAKLLYEGGSAQLFGTGPTSYETVAQGASSIAVQLRRERGASYPFGASFEVAFSADPGTFEVDVQDADVDIDSHYVSVGQIVSVNASFVGRIELPQFWTKFTRVNIVTLTNAVGIEVLVTH